MNLKELRLRKMLTQKALADTMRTTQQTVARWESGKTVLNADQIKELCSVLSCTAKQLLGDMRDHSDVGQNTHLFPVLGAPYGTLKVSLKTGVKEYPIDNASREDLLVQLSESFTESADQSDAPWLAVGTLDNRYLIINSRHLRKVELISDDVEAMPTFESAAVYAALESWPSGKVDHKTKEACEAAIQELGLDVAVSLALEFCVTLDDGSEHRADLTEGSAHDLLEFTNAGLGGEWKSFVELSGDGFERTAFVNRAAIVLVELPANLLRKLMNPGT